MLIILATFCITTGIAIVSTYSARHADLQRRAQSWIGGLLVGIVVFWILPEMAVEQGWAVAVFGVSASALCLAAIDRYVFPICPFCAAGMHNHGPAAHTGRGHHVSAFGWPLLVAGCIHSFVDGWTIALSQVASVSHASLALSWGAFAHKVPESVAIGFLAARLTSSRRAATGVVLLVQTAMLGGSILSLATRGLDNKLNLLGVPACACLLFLGLLALREESRLYGPLRAIRVASLALAFCGMAALALQFVPF
jgi:zinc transporter ZupT